MTRALFVLIGILLCCAACSSFFSGKVKVTLKVVGEDGKPVEGADVGVGFERNSSQGTKVVGERGTTYADGLFTATGKGNGFVSFGAHKEGYYDSYYSHTFRAKDGNRWQPWNSEFEILLRKVVNPVPMYARNTLKSIVEIPVVGESVGFDLIKFDWVAPYGSGAHSDFIFHLERRVVDRKDFDASLTVAFSNRHDGIQSYREELTQGSLFKLPRLAPENGYKDTLTLRAWRNKGETTVNRNFDFIAKDLNYIFRVRSKDSHGVDEKAMYGKIHGGLTFDPIFSNTAAIYFKYYLNPDYTRNLEYDPEQNLFENLPSREQVGIQ